MIETLIECQLKGKGHVDLIMSEREDFEKQEKLKFVTYWLEKQQKKVDICEVLIREATEERLCDCVGSTNTRGIMVIGTWDSKEESEEVEDENRLGYGNLDSLKTDVNSAI